MSRKALVTGAGGFIGSHMVRYLKDKGYWVRGVDVVHPEYHGSVVFFRLCMGPRRLAGRYLRNNARFVWNTTLQLTGVRRYPILGE